MLSIITSVTRTLPKLQEETKCCQLFPKQILSKDNRQSPKVNKNYNRYQNLHRISQVTKHCQKISKIPKVTKITKDTKKHH